MYNYYGLASLFIPRNVLCLTNNASNKETFGNAQQIAMYARIYSHMCAYIRRHVRILIYVYTQNTRI